MSIRIGLLAFPNLTQLDLTGPFEVLSRVENAEVRLVWRTREPVRSDTGLRLTPDLDFASAGQFDVVIVPGGGGVNALLADRATLAWLRAQASGGARWMASVCTGALVLGAAGLLRGYRATTHWASHEFLAAFEAVPVRARVVIDRGRITGGGVTAGIDFALVLASQLSSESAARAIQRQLEYDPAPPFPGGGASPAADASALARLAPVLAARRAAVAQAAAAMLNW